MEHHSILSHQVVHDAFAVWKRAVCRPLIAAFYSLPQVALFPLVFIVVGLNETSNIIMISLGPFFTVLINTMAAVLHIDSIYRDVARSFGASTVRFYTRVLLPASIPGIMAGVRLAVGLGC